MVIGQRLVASRKAKFRKALAMLSSLRMPGLLEATNVELEGMWGHTHDRVNLVVLQELHLTE